MDSHQSLYYSLLAAMGVVSCASGSGSSDKGGQVVTITPTPSGSAPETEISEPKRQGQKGWVKEADGTVHRATATSCDASLVEERCRGNERRLDCKVDSDCNASAHGACLTGMGMEGSFCGCAYACESDADCGPGKACVCKGTGGLKSLHSVCAAASCISDADCSGTQCGLSVHFNGCGDDVRLACRSDADKCRTDADCRRNGIEGASCALQLYSKDAMRWGCSLASCVPGRALRVEGEVRLAPPTVRDDFRIAIDLDVSVYSPALRQEAARYYETVAAFEHASVASFSRISLQLLALGAPASLLAEANRAALDEIEHARIGYSLAEAFSGRPKGPSALPAATAALSCSLLEFVKALIFEGCVGETLAAAEVREAARLAVDPTLRALLSRIADDEERHASFSWRVLVWALSLMDASDTEIVNNAFSQAIAHYDVEVLGADIGLEVVGILSARSMSLIRRQILRNVIEPCTRDLPKKTYILGLR